MIIGILTPIILMICFIFFLFLITIKTIYPDFLSFDPVKKVAKLLRNYIYHNENSIEKRVTIGFEKNNKEKYKNFDVLIELDNFYVLYSKLIKGSLVEILKKEKVNISTFTNKENDLIEYFYKLKSKKLDLSFVDQNEQYDSMVGVNDIKNRLTDEEVDLLINELTNLK